MTETKVTILMPAYNASRYIGEAIQSVLAQRFTAFELLIIDDGSTDNTASIVRSFSDKRIRLIQQENKGIAAALNSGLRLCKSELIARFDADDICYENRLQVQFNFMEDNPDVIVVGSGADYIDASGEFIFSHHPAACSHEEILQLPIETCPFIHASVMYRRTVVLESGYNEHAPSFQDHLLWQQLKSKGKLQNLNTSLMAVRLNPESLTIDERKRPKLFREIKRKALATGELNESDGKLLKDLIISQKNSPVQLGSYYSLLAKKFLWNNHDPVKAREHLRKAIAINPFDVNDYLLWPASFLPEPVLKKVYKGLKSNPRKKN